MFGKKNRETDNIGPSTGLAKILHKTAFILLYPFRKPLVFIAIVAILYLAPTFRGVKPAEVHLWYKDQIEKLWSSTTSIVDEKIKVVMPEFPSQPTTQSLEPTIIPEVANIPAKEGRRKMFEKAKDSSSLVAIDIMKSPKTQQGIQVVPVAEEPKPKKKLALYYINEPVNITGEAEAINANELKIGTETVFLYGIYVDPNTSKGQEGHLALKNIISGKTVNCVVNAYTYQGIATGMCFVGNININKAMVDGGYSKNVALD